MGARIGKLGEIPQRLKQFIAHDVRKNPILGLYLVIGVMVVGYAIYFAVVMYKDLTGGGDKPVVATPKVEQTKKAVPPKKQAPPKKEAPKQATQPPAAPGPEKVAEKTKPTDAEKLDISKWRSFELPDGSHISFPADWSETEIPAEKNILHGIQLQAPNTEASLKCYARSRKLGENYAKSIKETMRRGGYSNVQEEAKKINKLDVVRLSGVLTNTHMVVSIFDGQPESYFIVRLIAPKQEYTKLQPYYNAIVDSYRTAGKLPASMVSIDKIEQQLEKSVEDNKDYLVGTTIRIKLKSGAKHQGVVIAEDDSSITLEGFRFGGRYSFTVKKQDIVELIR